MENLIPIYPAIGESDFENNLSKKLEFIELQSNNCLYKHQELVRRYMSPYTPYDRLLLFHATGSGKTFICISIAEDHYNINRTKCLVLVRGETSRNNIIMQIKHWLEINNKESDYKSVKEYIKDRYEIYHQVSFCSQIHSMENDKIKKRYSNMLIIIDEAHNIATSLASKESILYDKHNYHIMWNFLHTVQNCKIIVLSATPMTDSIDRLSPILNLILPYDSRINIYDLKDHDLLINRLKGYISSYQTREDVAETIFIGKKLPINKRYTSYPLVLSTMVGYQKYHYLNNYKTCNKKDIYRSITHTALFCFQDGISGSKIMTEKMEKVTIEKKAKRYGDSEDKLKTLKCKSYKLKKEYLYEIMPIELNLRSCKYHSIIKEITSQINILSFVFIEEVQGSGLLLFACILEQLGYELYLGEDLKDLEPKQRYTICVGDKEICPNPDERIGGFNDPTNCYGKYVSVMLGSKVVGESITLMNVRQFHCALPHWNDSTIHQAIGRVVRSRSHELLKPNERNVKIYIHIAVLPGDKYSAKIEKSIDMKKIIISEEKELQIKYLENVLDTSSIENIFTIHHPFYSLNVSTFIRFFLKHHINVYISKLSSILSVKLPILFDDLYHIVKMPHELLLEVLAYFIINNVPIKNNNKIMFLRESMGILSAVYDPSVPYFTFNPLVNSHIIKKSSINEILYKNDINKLNYLLENFNYSDLNIDIAFNALDALNKLAWDDKLLLIEYSIQTSHFFSIFFSNSILKTNSFTYHFYNYRKSFKGSYKVSSRGIKPLGLTRKYDPLSNKWSFITSIVEKESFILDDYLLFLNKLESKFNIYSIYGVVSTIDSKLRIREINDSDYSYDTRRINRGRDIKTLSKNKLYEYIDTLINEFKKYDINIYNKCCDDLFTYFNINNPLTIFDIYDINFLVAILTTILKTSSLIIFI
jgi:superfamily II DNA or RNA helicase